MGDGSASATRGEGDVHSARFNAVSVALDLIGCLGAFHPTASRAIIR